MTRTSRVPKYRRHSSGLAFVQHRGRRFYLGKHGTPESQQRFLDFVARLQVDTEDPAPPPAVPGLTVNGLILAYGRHAESYYRKGDRPTSELANIKRALHAVSGLYGTMPAEQFGPRALKEVRERLIDDGLCRTAVNRRVSQIRRVFRWAVAEDLVQAGVWHALQAVEGLKRGRTRAKETEPIGPVSDATVDATLPHLPPVVADMVSFQRLTGCRPGEVCTLRPCDVNRSGDVWEYRPARHKTEHHGRHRIVFIGPKAQLILTAYLLRAGEAFCFSPAESEQRRADDRRAARASGLRRREISRAKMAKRRRAMLLKDHYTKDSFNRAVRRAVERENEERLAEAQRAGIKPDQVELLKRWSPNQLRHAAATEIRRRFGLEGAQVALGHATADVTQVYAERDQQLAARIAKEVG